MINNTVRRTYGASKEDDRRLDTVADTRPDVDGISQADRSGQRTEAQLGNTAQQQGNTDGTDYSKLTTTGRGPGTNPNPGTGSYDDYINAMATLQEKSQEEDISGKNQDLINGLVDSIVNRQFSYDLEEDSLYKQYRDRYIDQAGMAMRDTMGQAAALTGGYGSTYGQAAGQQAYDRTMQGLNDIVPQLEDRAYDRWITERAYNDDQRDKAKSELMSWIQMGYEPTPAELAEAGINAEQLAALKQSMQPTVTGSGKLSLMDFWERQTAALEGKGFDPAQIAAMVAEQASNKYPGSTNQISILGDMYVDGSKPGNRLDNKRK